jgi:hypothetical protein
MKLPKKPKQRSMKAIVTELWDLCRAITFKRHGIDCYTCPQKNIEGLNRQCGHGYPNGALGASMKYDLRILRPQCYNCNINHGGMGIVFWKRMETEIGKRKADKLYLECQASKAGGTNARNHFTALIGDYKQELAQMS